MYCKKLWFHVGKFNYNHGYMKIFKAKRNILKARSTKKYKNLSRQKNFTATSAKKVSTRNIRWKVILKSIYANKIFSNQQATRNHFWNNKRQKATFEVPSFNIHNQSNKRPPPKKKSNTQRKRILFKATGTKNNFQSDKRQKAIFQKKWALKETFSKQEALKNTKT